MKSFSAIAMLGALATTTSALNPIEVHEQQFIDSKTGNRFMVLGVDYQPGGQGDYGIGGDPLSDPETCLRDAALMQSLGVNTIRSYNVDPTLDHDQCVSIFNQAGIYMILDVNSPLEGESINRADPEGTYTSKYLTRAFSVIEAFKDYPNTLGFFGGNEIINDVPTAKDNPPIIRAVQRDLKNYIKNHASRQIPVGYSAADVREVLEDTWAYLQCSIGGGSNDMSRSDFFGLNSYSWCGDSSSFQISGYDVLVETFSNTTIPVFFSEYGCNDPQPRQFDEVQALYGPQMTTLSGGLVYEWTQEPSDYGIINTYSNGSAELRQDYDTLMAQYDKLDRNLITASNDTATSLQPPQCDSSLISADGFSTDFDIPDPPQGAQQLIANGIKNPPKGSIVRVTQTVVQVPVYATNGGPLQDLAISSRSDANLPGGGGPSTGAPGSTPTVTGGSSNGGGSSSSSALAAAPTAADFGVMANAVGAAALGVVAFAL